MVWVTAVTAHQKCVRDARESLSQTFDSILGSSCVFCPKVVEPHVFPSAGLDIIKGIIFISECSSV